MAIAVRENRDEHGMGSNCLIAKCARGSGLGFKPVFVFHRGFYQSPPPYHRVIYPASANCTTIMGESRSELLAWVNELLQINYTRVEQCGTGAAYCQVLDSIYRASIRSISFYPRFLSGSFAYVSGFSVDLPMTRVKMNAKHEYEFIANFKVMQNVFKAKRIDKVR